jgi:hypothetical protein
MHGQYHSKQIILLNKNSLLNAILTHLKAFSVIKMLFCFQIIKKYTIINFTFEKYYPEMCPIFLMKRQ